MVEYFYNVDFEIAAIIILTVFQVFVNSKKHLDIRRNIFYRWMTVFILIASVFDLYACLLNNFYPPESMVINYVVNIAISLTFVVNLELILLYMIEVIERIDLFVSPVFWALNSPAIFYIIIILLTPINHLVFFISDENKYMHGPGFMLLYILVSYYLIFAFLIVTFMGRKVELKKRLTCQLFLAMVLIGNVVQWFWFPNLILGSFCEVIGIFVLYFIIQSPEIYIDELSGAFNEKAFIKMIKDKTLRESRFSVATICFEDFPVSGSALKEQELLKNACTYFSSVIDISCFRVDRSIYLVTHDENMLEKVCQDFVEKGKNNSDSDPDPTFLESKILMLRCPEDMTHMNDILSTLKFFSKMDLPYSKIYYYSESVLKKRKRYDEIKELIRSAIINDEIEMYYQPIYSVETKKLDSAEALVRLKDVSNYEYLSPEEFIPIAEEENLILDLEERILDHVCHFIQREHLVNSGLRYIEVNLSGKQCKEKHLAYKLSMIVEECNIPAEFLNFEITETATIDMSQHFLYNMEKLIDEGYSFSLDDFGSGYSNLTRLSKLPLKIVKLDKDLVWSHFRNEDGRAKAVLTHIVQMLHKMGLEIVAEGVETDVQKEELINLNIDHLQGFYFSKPLPERSFLELLKQQEMAGKQ